MTSEQMRERILNKINEDLETLKNSADIVDVWGNFVRFKTSIQIALSLQLINMGEYLSFDTDGDHLYHDK